MKGRAWFNSASSVQLCASALSGVGNLGAAGTASRLGGGTGRTISVRPCPKNLPTKNLPTPATLGRPPPRRRARRRRALCVPPTTAAKPRNGRSRSEEHTSELQSLMRISYAVFCLKKKKYNKKQTKHKK